MNKVILSGNLCKDIEIQERGKNTVCVNNIAVKRDVKNSDGTFDTDFIQIVVWNQQARYLNDYASKGSKVELCGRWAVRRFEKDGQQYTVHECVVESIKVLAGVKGVGLEEDLPEEGDLPF